MTKTPERGVGPKLTLDDTYERGIRDERGVVIRQPLPPDDSRCTTQGRHCGNPRCTKFHGVPPRTEPTPCGQAAHDVLDEIDLAPALAILLAAVRRGAVLQLGPASGRLIWKRSERSGGIAIYDTHGSLNEVVTELAACVKQGQGHRKAEP